MANNLNVLRGQVQVGAGHLVSGSGQVADSSQPLSKAATISVSSVE